MVVYYPTKKNLHYFYREGTLIVGDTITFYRQGYILVIGSHILHVLKSDYKVSKLRRLTLLFTKNIRKMKANECEMFLNILGITLMKRSLYKPFQKWPK
ncbi:hypothetical protein A9996_12350 [Gelidibacter algens]|nr:hypothetical protein A9996_12350 [Gelidibacter algens]